MPRTLGGLFGFVLMSVLATAVGLYVINRVAPIRNLINGQKAA